MNYTILNLTDKSRNNNPQHKDFLQYTYENGLVVKKHYIDQSIIEQEHSLKLQEELELEAKQWRDSELSSTDNVAQTPDYPNRDAILVYRQELRDWPSTDAFPETKPVKP